MRSTVPYEEQASHGTRMRGADAGIHLNDHGFAFWLNCDRFRAIGACYATAGAAEERLRELFGQRGLPADTPIDDHWRHQLYS